MKKFFQWFSRFSIVNLPIVATAILGIALLGIILLVMLKGLVHFAVSPVYKISHPQLSSPVLGEVERLSGDEMQIRFFDPDTHRINLLRVSSDDLSHTIYRSAFVVKTQGGKTYFAQDIMVEQQKLTLDDWEQRQIAAKNIALKIDTLQNQMHPLELRYAQYMQQDIPLTAPVFARLSHELDSLLVKRNRLLADQQRLSVVLQLGNANNVTLPLTNVALIWQPNRMTYTKKIAFAVSEVWRFITSDHTAQSGSAGVFPALFGTVLMVLLMTIVVMPMGVLTAIYLHEFAPENKITTLIRVIIINLAGIPSIVYGVFGLGLFVIGLGVNIDQLFYAENLPSPTFGTPGLLWASLTMALLTLPTVIVATEEGLSQVPEHLRTGALALGATHYEAIRYNVLPVASPNILTGAILAIARAASEVAPLLLVGAVIYAPTLPVDDTFPYIHLERQFMHLGVLIFDSVFHASTYDNSSMMFAICLLLISVVLVLNSLAAFLRAKLRLRYERFS